MADQRARHFRGEQHRHLPGRQRARLQPCQGALGRAAADGLRVLQVGTGDGAAVPAVALHAVALPGDQRAANGMVAAAFAADEAMRVGVDRQALRGGHRGAIGIGDARIGTTPGRFAGQGKFHRVMRVQRPRVPGVQVGEVACHQRRVGQARGRIVLGVAGDGAGLGHGRLQAAVLQVGGAGAALALAEIHGDGDAAVVGGLDRFHFAQADIHVQPAVLTAADLGLAGTQRAGLVQQPLRDASQVFEPLQAVVGGEGSGGDGVQCFILSTNQAGAGRFLPRPGKVA